MDQLLAEQQATAKANGDVTSSSSLSSSSSSSSLQCSRMHCMLAELFPIDMNDLNVDRVLKKRFGANNYDSFLSQQYGQNRDHHNNAAAAAGGGGGGGGLMHGGSKRQQKLYQLALKRRGIASSASSSSSYSSSAVTGTTYIYP